MCIMFGFDWARGFIAPFADRDGVPFATPSDAVEVILGIVLSARDGVVASPSLIDNKSPNPPQDSSTLYMN